MWQSIKLYLFSKDPLVIKIIESSVKVAGIPLVVFENFDPSFIHENEAHSVFAFFDDSITNISGIPELPHPKILLHKKNATPIKGFDHYIKKPFLPTEIIDYLKPQLPQEETPAPPSSPDRLFGSDLLKFEDDEDLNLNAILQHKDTIPPKTQTPPKNDMPINPSTHHINQSQATQKNPKQHLDSLSLLEDISSNSIYTHDSMPNSALQKGSHHDFIDNTTDAQLQPEVVEVDFDLKSLDISDALQSNRILKNDYLASKVAELDKKNFSHHIDFSDLDDLFDTKDKEEDLSIPEDFQDHQTYQELDIFQPLDEMPKSIKDINTELAISQDDIPLDNTPRPSILSSSEIDEVKHLLEAINPKVLDDSPIKEDGPQEFILDSEFDGIKEALQEDFLDFNLENTTPHPNSPKPTPMPLDEHLMEFEQPFETISSDIEELELEEKDILEALNLPISHLPKVNNNTLNCSGQELLELINTTPKEQLQELLKDAQIYIQLAKHAK